MHISLLIYIGFWFNMCFRIWFDMCCLFFEIVGDVDVGHNKARGEGRWPLIWAVCERSLFRLRESGRGWVWEEGN